MEIRCPKCENFIDAKFFTKDSTKPSGYDSICKTCRKAYRMINKDKELARWKRNYMPGSNQRKKHVIRSRTRNKYGSAKERICTCGKPALEWHHFAYEVDAVVALCHTCHESI